MFYIGIDPGKKTLKTTGVCILEEKRGLIKAQTKTVLGRNVPRIISKYLKNTKVAAIEAPITYGKGKGKMRLWEKFFSQKAFRKRRCNPLPPAFMEDVINNSMVIVEFLKKQGFELNKDIIETFYPLLKRVIRKTVLSKIRSRRNGTNFKTPHEYQASYCAYVAYLHSKFETFWIGYEDGKVFLPKPKYWYKKEWKWFEKVFLKKHPFRYKYLTTNLELLLFQKR